MFVFVFEWTLCLSPLLVVACAFLMLAFWFCFGWGSVENSAKIAGGEQWGILGCKVVKGIVCTSHCMCGCCRLVARAVVFIQMDGLE